MKLRTLSFSLEYVVDMDNKEMVERAKAALIADIETLYNNDDLADCIQEINYKSEDISDIPDFLKEAQL